MKKLTTEVFEAEDGSLHKTEVACRQQDMKVLAKKVSPVVAISDYWLDVMWRNRDRFAAILSSIPLSDEEKERRELDEGDPFDRR